jgi:MFS transporter, AAHS family, 4-hydroxybenzoate transporter
MSLLSKTEKNRNGLLLFLACFKQNYQHHMTNLTGTNKITGSQLAVILICFLMNMLDGMDVMVVSYSASAISKDWNISPQSLGIVFSAGLLGMTLGATLLAPLADKTGRRKLIIVSNIIMGVSVFGTAWAPSVQVLTIMRVVSGIGIGSMLANIATLASENAPVNRKDFWVSFVMAGYPMGAMLSGFAVASVLPEFCF